MDSMWKWFLDLCAWNLLASTAARLAWKQSFEVESPSQEQ